MNQSNSNNIWLFFELLARKRGLIFSIVIVATLASVVAALVLPKWYQAKVLLLPPKNVTMPLPDMARLAEAVSVTQGLDLPGLSTPSDVYAAMLKSHTIADTIIHRFDLKNRYKCDYMIETYDALMDHIVFRVTDAGLVEILFEDKDPQFAADVANSFVSELERINLRIANKRASLNREFIGDRLEQLAIELDSARARLERFQMENRAIDFDQQTKLAVEQAIKLKVAQAEVELDIDLKKRMLGKNNPELVQLRHRREAIQTRLRLLESTNPDSSFFSLPISSIPRLKGAYEVLYSRVKVNESIYSVLLAQYEQAKIQEQDRSSTISVLDFATAPDLKYRPRRTLIVAGTFGISFFLAILIAALLNYFERLKVTNPDDYQRAVLFFNAFIGWLPGITKRK